jgi:hypothetical protein
MVSKRTFLERARVTTRPTEKGVQAISPFSEWFGLHMLVEKPLKQFFDHHHNCYGPSGSGGINAMCVMRTGESGRSLFLRLVEAEKLGLIKIDISLPEDDETFIVDVGLFRQLVILPLI